MVTEPCIFTSIEYYLHSTNINLHKSSSLRFCFPNNTSSKVYINGKSSGWFVDLASGSFFKGNRCSKDKQNTYVKYHTQYDPLWFFVGYLSLNIWKYLIGARKSEFYWKILEQIVKNKYIIPMINIHKKHSYQIWLTR